MTMTLTCEQAELLISRLLDGELETESRAGVEAHLAGCAACRAALDAWARIGVASIDLLRGAVPATPLRPPGPLSERRLAALRARRRSGAPAPAAWIPVAAAAGVLAALALLLLSGRSPRQETLPDRDPLAVAPIPQAATGPGPDRAATPRVPAESPGAPAPGAAPAEGTRPVPSNETPRETPPSPVRVVARAPDAAAPPAPAAPPTAGVPASPPAETVAAAAVVARVERVEGTAVVVTAAGRAPAAAEQALHAGQSVETSGPVSRAWIRLPDGTRLELGRETSASFPPEPVPSPGKPAAGHRVELALGSLAAEAARQPADRPAVFATPHAEARVLGTRLLLVVTADATRLEVQEGRVRLTRLADRQWADVNAGQFAVAAKGPAPFARAIPPPPAAPPAGWKDCFNGKDLAGWRPTRGRWSVADGTVVGEDPGGEKARIESEQAWGDFELACRIRVSGARLAEFQVRGYALFAQLTLENPNAWRELKVASRGTALQATLDGRKVPIEPGEGGDLSVPGAIAFYVSKGGKIEIREARIREIGP
jgi:hypothetical protein